MRFNVLGPLEVRVDGEQLAIKGVKERRLLGLLLSRATRVVPVDDIIEALWDDEPPPSAAKSVQVYVVRVRKMLGPQGRAADGSILSRRGRGYALCVGRGQVDVLRFEDLVARAREAAAASAYDIVARVLREALSLWRGSAYADFLDTRFGAAEAARLEEMRLSAVEARIDADLALGRHAEVAAELAGLVEQFPLRERLAGMLMTALYRCGRRGEALAAYDTTRRVLAEQLGLDPGPELAGLQAQVLADDRALAAPVMVSASVSPPAVTAVPAEPAGAAVGVVPRQLPAGVGYFAGRDSELKALEELVGQPGDPGTPGTVVVTAVGGMAGVGKTALAVHWAHQVAGRFPDGQLYVNLRGFDPAGPPMTPAEAIRGFLDAFEVPAVRIPVSPDAQAALYRSLLARRRVLVVLDNARDTDQVRPLLPGSPGSSVVVTSRNRLTSLIAEGAYPLTVGLFTVAEARQMLARRLGEDRVAAELQAVQQIIDRCARLPLALSIVAARAAAHPDFPLMALAEELRDAEGRLQALDAGEAATSVTAVFSWSYRQLSHPAARLFRLLGLHPGPDITAPAAASLAAVPLADARPMLAELARANLITEHTPGRFTFHDLLRAYAADLAAHDPDIDRNAALQRMLEHYLHTAQAAWHLSYPHQQHSITLAPPLPGVTPEEPADYPAAWAWFTAEYPVLLAAIQLAAATGYHTHAWQLPHTLVPFFERQGHWHDFAATYHAALTATQRHADQQGQAHAHLGIGHARARIGDRDGARPHLHHALRLFEELGDQAGQSYAHNLLGMTFHTEERYEEALTHMQQAVNLAQAHGGYPRGLAAALNSLGWVHALLGDAQQALTYSQQSLALFQRLGDRWGEAAALDSIGYVYHRLGRHQRAASYFEQALAIDKELGDLYCQATDYDRLGDALHAVGNTAQARNAWRLALNILDQLSDVPHPGVGYADPQVIRSKLRHHA